MFGSLGYWHLIGQDKKQPTETLHGTIEQRASALLAMWRAKEIRQLAPDDNPGAAVDIARAMALELAVAAAARLGAGIPSSVIELVRELLPKWAYVTVDPTAVYSGDHAGKGAPDSLARMRLKAICRDLDCAYAARTGQKKTTQALAEEVIDVVRKTPDLKHLADAWRDAPNVARTVMRWRRGYRSDLDEAMLRNST